MATTSPDFASPRVFPKSGFSPETHKARQSQKRDPSDTNGELNKEYGPILDPGAKHTGPGGYEKKRRRSRRFVFAGSAAGAVLRVVEVVIRLPWHRADVVEDGPGVPLWFFKQICTGTFPILSRDPSF